MMFTWSNDQVDLLFQKLDRCLMSADWGALFPLVFVSALDRGLSDHTPLLLDTDTFNFVESSFKFELSWLLREELEAIVLFVWELDVGTVSSIEEWQFRLRTLRRNLKGWNRNVESSYKKEKSELLAHIDLIDKHSELYGLHVHDLELRGSLKNKLKMLMREDNIKWWQRAKEKDLLLGDGNTKFFMTKASSRRRQNRISGLKCGDRFITKELELTAHITDFYKQLFGSGGQSEVDVCFNFPKLVSAEENRRLLEPLLLMRLRLWFSLWRKIRPLGLMVSP